MSRLFNKLQVFYSPDDLGGGPADDKGGVPKGGDKEDDINFLALDDDKTDDKKDEIDLKEPKKEKKDDKEDKDDDEHLDDKDDKDDENKDDEDDDLEELVKDLDEEVDEEKLELVTPVRRREILKKYPNVFKDFPYLEKAYYREQQFTEILPTIADAKEAVNKATTLDKFEKDLMGGNTETILRTVKDTDPETFNRIVDAYLPTLAKVDEKAYNHVLSNVSKHTVNAMVQEARRTNDEALSTAAKVLYQFVFGTTEWVPPSQLASDKPKEDEGKNKLDEERKQFQQERFNTARTDLNNRLNNSLKSAIEINIDPRNSMSEYVKRTAIRDANEQLDTLIRGDRRFSIIIDKLWEKAFSKNFDKDSLDTIRSAYVSKAKTLLPSVIKKARNEALKGMGKRVKEDDNNDDKNRPEPKKDKSQSNNRDTKKGEVPRGMRTIDFLNQD